MNANQVALLIVFVLLVGPLWAYYLFKYATIGVMVGIAHSPEFLKALSKWTHKPNNDA